MGKVEPVTDSEYTGIFAFEGDWTPDNLTEDWSIRPNLETLRDMYRIGFIHRRIGTSNELRYYVEKWLTKGKENYRGYKVGYFAFHGEPGLIYPGEGGVRLYQLERWINGKAKGRVIAFHSCSTLNVKDERIKVFLNRTKASAVVGYAKDIDSLEAIAFDLLVLWALTGHEPRVAEEILRNDYGELFDGLGLTFHHA